MTSSKTKAPSFYEINKALNKELNNNTSNGRIVKFVSNTKQKILKLFSKKENFPEGEKMKKIKTIVLDELSETLKSRSPISINLELYKIIKKINNHLTTIKDDGFINEQINRIEFESPIKINGKEIECTGELDHKNNEEIDSSINEIKNRQAKLKNLDITKIRNRLENNINTLKKIREEQSLSSDWPRNYVDDINNDLEKQKMLQEKINRIMEILSNIINIQEQEQQQNQEGENNGKENSSTNELTKLQNDFNSIQINTREITQFCSDPDIENLVTISNINDTNEIKNKQESYNSLLEKVKKEIEKLEHEKNLRELINSLENEGIYIEEGFLPFCSNETIAKAGDTKEETDNYINDFTKRLNQLNIFEKEIENIDERYATNIKKLENIKTLQTLHKEIKKDDPEIQNQLNAIINISENALLLGKDNYKESIGECKINLGGSLESPINLNLFNGWHVELNKTYSLRDKEGKPLLDNDGKLTISKKKTNFKIEGISINDTLNTININNLKIEPIEQIDFPLDLDLNVKVTINDFINGVTVDHYKPLHLTINPPELHQKKREDIYNRLDMDNRTENKYKNTTYREELEDNTIREIICEGGDGSTINKIDNKTKHNIIKTIRKRINFPLITEDDLKEGFKYYITKESLNVPIQYLISEAEFKNFIEIHRAYLLENYAKAQIYRKLSEYRDSILLSFGGQTKSSKSKKKEINYTQFLTGKDTKKTNNSFEGNDNENYSYEIKTDIKGKNKIITTIYTLDNNKEINIAIEGSNHDKIIENILNMDSINGEPFDEKLRCKLALEVLKSIIELYPQTLTKKGIIKIGDNIYNGIEIKVDNGNLMFNGYNANNTSENIFDESTYQRNNNLDENEIKKIKNNIRTISTQINNIMNGLAQDYQEANKRKNRHLLRYDTAKRIKGGDIKRLRGRIKHKTKNKKFDPEKDDNFENGTTFSTKIKDKNDNYIIIKFENGEFHISGEFNDKPYNYEDATLTNILKKEIDGKKVFEDIEQDIIHEITKIKNKMENNFSFFTEITDTRNLESNPITIIFNNGKFLIKGIFEGKNYDYEAKDLGSILRKRINGKGVFDGIELELIREINTKYVEKLVENPFIQNEIFVIADLNTNKTGKIYFFQGGTLSYIKGGTKELGHINTGRVDSEYFSRLNPHTCNNEEKNEFLQNPLLAGKLLREMRKMLTLSPSKKITDSKITRKRKSKIFKEKMEKITDNDDMTTGEKLKSRIKVIGHSIQPMINKIIGFYPNFINRYSIDPNLKITKEIANKDLEGNYHAENEDEINSIEQERLKAVAYYLNGRLSLEGISNYFKINDLKDKDNYKTLKDKIEKYTNYLIDNKIGKNKRKIIVNSIPYKNINPDYNKYHFKESDLNLIKKTLKDLELIERNDIDILHLIYLIDEILTDNDDYNTDELIIYCLDHIKIPECENILKFVKKG